MNKHSLLMLICCLIPLGLLTILWLAGISESYLLFGVMLLCPLMHIIMMRGMHREKGDDNH